MCPTSISVWYACKTCKASFQKLTDFIEHKKVHHYKEFLNIKCIVFEERTISNHDDYGNTTWPLGQTQTATQKESHEHIMNNNPPAAVETSIQIEPCIDHSSYDPTAKFFQIDPNNIGNPQHFFVAKPEFSLPHMCLNAPGSETQISTSIPQNNPPTVNNNNAGHFQCKLCHKKLNSKTDLQIHVRLCVLYSEHRERYCVQCNKICGNAQLLKTHTLKFHGSPGSGVGQEGDGKKVNRCKFKCLQCSKEFVRMSSLITHTESHKSKDEQFRPFQCPVCHSSFCRKDNLTRHLKSHSDERPFKCPQPDCEKTFKFRHHLRGHVATHSDSRPYNCPHPECDKTFKHQKQISRHLKTH